MKVPRITRARHAGVDTMGRHDIRGPMRVADAHAAAAGIGARTAQIESQMWTKAIGDVTGAIEDYAEQQSDFEVQEANIAMNESATKYMEQHLGREDYDPSEVDQSIQTNRNRARIPAYEVGADMQRRYSNQSLETIAKSISNPRVRREWMAKQKMVTSKNYIANKANGIKTQRAYQTKMTLEQAEQAVTAGDYDKGRIIVDNSNLPAHTKLDLSLKIDQQEEGDGYTELIRTGDVDGIERAMAMLAEEENASVLSPTQQASYLSKLESARTKAYKDINAAEDERKAANLSDFQVKMDASPFSVTTADIEGMYRRKEITPQQRTALRHQHRMLKKAATTASNTDAAIAQRRVDAKLGAGYPVEPGNTDEEKVADKRFEANMPTTNENGERDQYIAQFIQDYKYVPESLRNLMISGNVADKDVMTQEAEKYIHMMKYAPLSMYWAKGAKMENIRDMAALMQAGMDKSAAFDTVAGYAQMDKEAKKELTRQVTDAAAGDEDTGVAARADYLSEKLSKEMGVEFEVLSPSTWWGGDPGPTMGMMTTFKTLVKANLSKVPDLTIARQKAWDTIKMTYTKTTINGKPEMMRHGPVAADPEALQKQLAVSYGKDKDIKVISDLMTDRLARFGKPISYAIYERDEKTGSIFQRKRWTPDYAAIKAEEEKKVLDEARKLRVQHQTQRRKAAERAEGRKQTGAADRPLTTPRTRKEIELEEKGIKEREAEEERKSKAEMKKLDELVKKRRKENEELWKDATEPVVKAWEKLHLQTDKNRKAYRESRAKRNRAKQPGFGGAN